jgi:hypothetical protein
VPDPDKVKLLFGPYKPPPLKRGDVAFCYIRDYPVVVIGWSDAPIPWPRCLPLDPPRQGRGLLIDDELARASLHESALAVAHGWDVNVSTVWHWRKALGVTRKNNQGTYRLVLGAIGATLESRFGEGGPQRPRGRPAVWASWEVALLGALSDREVARRTGRSVEAVGKKRLALGRPPVTARGRVTRG